MIPKTPIEFDNLSKKVFGISEFNTLSYIKEKIRLVLGGEYTDKERIEIAYNRAMDVLNLIFDKKDIWLRVILWDDKININELGEENAGFIKFQKTEGLFRIIYFHLPVYNKTKVGKIVKSIIDYELGSSGLNITCLYFNFDVPIVANVYDDRGMDIVSINNETCKLLKNEFHSLLNE